MRRMILAIFLGLCLIVTAQGQTKNAGCFLRMVEPENSELTLEDDFTRILFEFDEFNYFCTITIKNKTNEILCVNWNEAIIVLGGMSSGLIFDESRLIDVGNLEESRIAPESSIFKSVASSEYIRLNMPFYTKKWVKKHGTQYISFFIPVSTASGFSKQYSCKISVSIQ